MNKEETRDEILKYFGLRQALFEEITRDKSGLTERIYEAFQLIKSALGDGKKILIFGNGGSAAQAQHFAAELVCQFEKKRQALPAIALTVDSSILTAQSNDYGFDTVFSRQVEALASAGDVVIGLTTSDTYRAEPHSRNILMGFMAAREKRAKTIGLFSFKTFGLLQFVDVPIVAPHHNTALIQEVHLAIIHLLCKLIETNLIKETSDA